MDGGAMPLHAGCQCTAVGVQAFELRQQCRMNVQHAAAPARDEPRRQQPHETGEADQIEAGGGQGVVERAFERLAVSAERPVIDDRSRDTRLLRARETRGIGLIGQDQNDLRRIIRCLGRLDECRHVRAAAGDQYGNALFGHAPGQTRSSCPRKPTPAPSFAVTTSPRSTQVSPFAAKHSIAGSAAAGSSTATMPMPQLKVRSISASVILPLAASHLNTGRTGTRSRSSATAKPSGNTRGILSTKPPPVMWASALTALVWRIAARHERT